MIFLFILLASLFPQSAFAVEWKTFYDFHLSKMDSRSLKKSLDRRNVWEIDIDMDSIVRTGDVASFNTRQAIIENNKLQSQTCKIGWKINCKTRSLLIEGGYYDPKGWMTIKEGTSWSEAIECACQPMPNACGIELEAKRRTLSPEAFE